VSFENILYQAHSGVRWLVVLATIVALVALIIGMVQKRPYEAFAKRFMFIFARAIEVQWLLGLLLIVVLGQWAPYQIEHAVTLTIAVVAAHLDMPFRRQADSRRYYAAIGAILVTLVLVYIGVARLPQGWMG